MGFLLERLKNDSTNPRAPSLRLRLLARKSSGGTSAKAGRCDRIGAGNIDLAALGRLVG
jgi:hypothetical protein